MDRKVVGWLDLIFAGFGVTQQTIMLLFVYPRLSVLYKDFGADLPTITRLTPYLSLVVIIFLLGVMYVGYRLAFGKTENKKLLKVGIGALIAIFLFAGYLIATSALGAITPLYSLTSHL